MSQSAEAILTRNLLVKVARWEMKEALSDGRLKRAVPLRIAVKELKRALKERRKVARLFEREMNLDEAVQRARAELLAQPNAYEPAVEAEYEVSR